MKRTSASDRWQLTVAVSVLLWLTGCAPQRPIAESEKALALVYDTPEEIQAMPACKAMVVERGPCYVRLKKESGDVFLVGGPGATADVVQFLQVLRDGQAYRFPETFQRYQEQRRRGGQ